MFKFFTTDLRRNLIKILCLSVGLAVGFLLVAKIYFQQTYDSFFSNIDHIYTVKQSTVMQDKYSEWGQTPGGTAVELMRTFPEITKATRYTYLDENTSIKLEDGRVFDVDGVALADSCLFDVLSTPVIEGNPSEALGIENNAMIPRSVAEKIGGDVIGLRISNVSWGDDYKATIAGVYEDYPLNSSVTNALYIALPTIKHFMQDGTENLLGNDRYLSYVTLEDGVDPDDLHPLILEHLKTKLPEQAFSISDYKVWLRPLKGDYSANSGVKRMSLMLGLLAVVMLMCASLNYLLIVIGQLAGRAKEMAIRKCYGTGRRKLFTRVMGESIFFLAISMGIAVLLAFSFSNLCKELLGYTPQQLFSTGRVWLTEGLVCLFLLIFTGIIPSIIYSRTPVVHAFRSSAPGKNRWKLVLLAIQFFATGLILCLLVLIGRQYNLLGNVKMGFEYENLAIFPTNGMKQSQLRPIIEELRKLPFVESVGSASSDISSYASGNMLWTEDHYEDQVNVADMYFFNPETIDALGLKLIQGRNFNATADSTVNEVIVEERAISVFKQQFGITEDDLIGKVFYITGHGDGGVNPPMTIVGVIENIYRGGFESDQVDTRVGVLFPASRIWNNVYVRFSELTPERMKEAQKVIDSMSGDTEVYITPYKSQIEAKRDPVRRFGTSVMVVGIAILIIALIGLIGYVADEVNRRAKEIAIRKVNGTSGRMIVRLFCIDILRVALPSLIAGGAVAMIIGEKWLSQFTQRVSLSPLGLCLCLILLLVLITGVVVINCLRVARSNPVDYLRSE